MRKYLLWFTLMGITWGSTFSQTTINSNITTNTTWDLAGSPYLVVQSITINTGVTLTIDPGVEVILDSIDITVNGNIQAVGTATDSIKFLSAIAAPSGNVQYGFKWLGFQVFDGTITMEYVYAELAWRFLNYQNYSGTPSLSLSNSSFVENRHTVYELDGPPSGLLIDSCYFKNSAYAISGTLLRVEHSTFDKFDTGIDVYEGEIRNCTFIDNTNFGINLVKGDIRNNYFYYTPAAFGANFGVRLGSFSGFVDQISVEGNRFEGSYGIFTGAFMPNLITIKNNIFCTDSITVMATSPSGNLLDLTNNCWCNPDSAHIASRMINGTGFPLGAPFMPIDSSCVPSQVYPGDANHNQIANNFDLLEIGIHYGKTGPVRANASLNWVGQDADAWGDTIPATGADIKHVDTNGDGIIDDNDTLAITLNYGLTHTANKGGTHVGPDLYYDMPAGPINPGDTIAIGIMLGTVDTPVVNLYGIGFSATFDSSMVKPGSMKINYNGSWIGTKGTDMLTLNKEFFNDQKVDLALCRNDQMNQTGYGKIAEIIVVIDDDIFKQSLPFAMDFQDILAISNDETEIDIEGIPGITNVEEEEDTSSTSVFRPIGQSLSIYPSPARDFITISSSGPELQKVSFIDIQGRMIRQERLDRGVKATISTDEFSPGIYVVLIETNRGAFRRKVVVK
jgi:hypothetical protein